jgi:hypothetical protein
MVPMELPPKKCRNYAAFMLAQNNLSSKVTVFIRVSDPFPHPMITSQCTFPLTYSCTIPEGAMNASA